MNKMFTRPLDGPQLCKWARSYAFKSDLKIKWIRPEKIPCIKPEKSGDLEARPPLNRNEYLPKFRNCKELETANEYVKRLFTVEFNRKKQATKLYLNETSDAIKAHEYDENSIEVILARWTGKIRAWQEVTERFPREKQIKVQLKELIDKRKKYLKNLRKNDYKKFEWLLEKLNLVYKPPPSEFRWVARRESLVKLTHKYSNEVKQDRIDALRLKFESEQPAFLEEKIRSLEFIRDEQRECGVDVTITQQEIDDISKQLEELKLKKIEEEEY